MSVHTLPVTPARQHEIRAALEASDKALEELLRQAVLAACTGGLRPVGSIRDDRGDALTMAYLHAAEIMLDRPGLQQTLAEAMGSGTRDLPTLTRLARSCGPAGPDAA